MENVGAGTKRSTPSAELLLVVKELSLSELDDFVKKVNSIYSKRQKEILTKKEAMLLKEIQEVLSNRVKARHLALKNIGAERELTAAEAEELLNIIDSIDDLNLKRAKAARELAALRKMPVSELFKFFNISQIPNV